MKSIRYILLVSTCLFFPNEGQAEIDLTFGFSELASSNPTLHTHHTPVELKPISNFKHGIKFASTCFLPNCFPDDNYNLDYNKQCIDDGYSSSCPSGYVPDYSQRCPFNSSMFKCKPCSNSCPYGYSTSACGYNQIQTGTSSNECGDTCYGCRDKNCGGYSLSSCPSNAYCSSCPDDSSLLKISSCYSGYVKSRNSCVNDTCPSGYSPVDNCEFGSQKKTTASGKVCYQCNSCTPSNCIGYDSYTCAAGADCDSCSQGCGLSAKYKFKSCQTGYYSSAGNCEKCGTSTSCSSGESLVNICTNGKGDCVNCRDENSTFNPCKGYFICDSTKVGDGKTCDCGGITYHERCLVPETCNTDSGYYNSVYHLAVTDNSSMFTIGGYKVAEKCIKQDGTKIFWYGTCNSLSLDGNGNYGPCKGKVDGEGEIGTGACSCGGKTYYDAGSLCNTDGGNYNGVRHGAVTDNSSMFTIGYYKVAPKCTKKDGTKIVWYGTCNSLSLDGNGNYAPCKGKIDGEGEVGTGACSCGGKTYYDAGSLCNTDGGNYNGVRHGAVTDNSSMFTIGYYKVAPKCTKKDGTKIVWFASCTNTSLDGNGNYGPCKGKTDCGSDFAVGDTCTCGGKTYGSACATTCNYEETPQSCSSKGKKFTFKCGSSEGNQYGICE